MNENIKAFEISPKAHQILATANLILVTEGKFYDSGKCRKETLGPPFRYASVYRKINKNMRYRDIIQLEKFHSTIWFHFMKYKKYRYRFTNLN